MKAIAQTDIAAIIDFRGFMIQDRVTGANRRRREKAEQELEQGAPLF